MLFLVQKTTDCLFPADLPIVNSSTLIALSHKKRIFCIHIMRPRPGLSCTNMGPYKSSLDTKMMTDMHRLFGYL